MTSDETLYIAVGSDYRIEPVVANTPETCSQLVTNSMSLDPAAGDIENWERRHKKKVHNWEQWIWRSEKHWHGSEIGHVSIHSSQLNELQSHAIGEPRTTHTNNYEPTTPPSRSH